MHRCRSAPLRAGDKGAGEGVSRARLPSVERLLDVLEPNPRPRGPARRCPQVCGVGAQADGEGLTLVSPRAYRWPVTRCRLVPHVHAEPRTRGACVVGGRCQPKGDTDRASAHGHNLRRRRGDPLVLAGSTLHRRPAKENISREQAYVPAEQPPPPQGARLPPALAHPCRPRDPQPAAPQGPQEHLGLSDGPLGRCSPPPTVCVTARTSEPPHAAVGAPGHGRW